MERQEGGSSLPQEGGHHTEQGVKERLTGQAQALPSVGNTTTDQHDLSYLAGPPFPTPGQSGETKRYFHGIAENANTLGISRADLLRSDSQSLFHSISSATQDQSYLPVALRPSRIQHRYPHHPFFDCIPIPSFRDRAILAAAATPPLNNRFEICFDMFAGGLTYNGDPSVEEAWTFSDTFRRKWEALLNFDLDELQRRADLRTGS